MSLPLGSEVQMSTNGARDVNEKGQIGGERNTSSTNNNYDVIKNECNATIISTTAAVTLGGGVADDTFLLGIHVHTALTGTCVIAGFADEAGNALSYTIPAAFVGHIPFYAARNLKGALTITCSNAADDNKVMALWRPV